MRKGGEAELMRFLKTPKHWKSAREIVSMMKLAEAEVVRELWHEVGVRLKQKGRLEDPQYSVENNLKYISSPVIDWPEYVSFDIGQSVEAGRRYLYCEIFIEIADKRSRGLLKRLKAEEFLSWQDSVSKYFYREFTTSLEPEDWPMHGRKTMKVLADEITQKGTEFLSEVGRLIKRERRKPN